MRLVIITAKGSLISLCPLCSLWQNNYRNKFSAFSVPSVAKNIGLNFSVAEGFDSVNLCESVSKKTLDYLCPLWQKN